MLNQKYFVEISNNLIDVFTINHVCKYNIKKGAITLYCIKIEKNNNTSTIEYDDIKLRDLDYSFISSTIIRVINSGEVR